jgi:uncharacterized protein
MVVLIVIVLAVLLTVLFFGHLALYWFLVSVFPALGNHLPSVRIMLGVLWISFIVASLLSLKFNTIGTRTLYRISAAWLGFFLYLLLGAFAYTVALAPFPAAPQETASQVGEILIGISIIVGIYGIINANHIRTTSIRVLMPNLPERWKSRRAVFVSDLHLGQVRAAPFAKRIASKIRELKPDIVFIGGDIYDGVAVDTQGVIEPLSKLQAPLGVYFITGNHEEFFDNTKYLSAIREAGIKILMDEKVMIDGVQLIGVDYAHSSKKAQLDGILQNLHIDREAPAILLKHVPFDLDVAQKHGITLQLSGHTHRAQVFPFTFLTRWIFKGFDYGLHSLRAMQVYTSSGVGTWGPPLRVGTKSEIVEILFR